MGRKLKKFRAYVFTVAILLSFFLAYPQYASLGAARFLTAGPVWKSLENRNQQDLATDLPDQLEKIVLASYAYPSHLGTHSFVDSFLLHSQGFSPEHKTSILRC